MSQEVFHRPGRTYLHYPICILQPSVGNSSPPPWHTSWWLSTLGGGKILIVQRYPGYHNFAPGAPWVGGAYLLQDSHGVPDMPLKGMDPHSRPHLRPSPTPLDGSVPRSFNDWERNLIRAWLSTRGRGTSIPAPSRCLPVLCLWMDCQRS